MRKYSIILMIALFFLVPLRTTGSDYAEQIAEEDRMAELELLAILVRAESGNQSMSGKQAVAGVVLNRVDSTQFPNTITAVLEQPGQFSCMTDGGYDKACWTVDETDYQAVARELEERKYRDALYFRTGHYHSGRTALYKIGAHYFSK